MRCHGHYSQEGLDSVLAALMQLCPLSGVVSEAGRKTEWLLVGYIVVTSAGQAGSEYRLSQSW